MCIKVNIIRCFKILSDKVFDGKRKKMRHLEPDHMPNTIKAFTDYDGTICTLQDAESALTRFGKKNPKKTLIAIKEIIETGTLEMVELALKSGVVNAVTNLTNVYSNWSKKKPLVFTKSMVLKRLPNFARV